jgi:gamma-glutamyltranspeptidase/glutathione hydrolase
MSILHFAPRLWSTLLVAGTLASVPIHSLAASVAPVAAENAMVVTAQHLATKVGVDVLKRGGNAVDAAVAVGYALAVVYPAAGNLGGGGFMTVAKPSWTSGRKRR